MSRTLAFGLFGLSRRANFDHEVMARLASAAEAAGFDSLWEGEHVVLPDPRTPESPMDPDDPILDPLVALTYLASLTKRVRLGTGIVILPQRHPLVLAKQVASLDVLSGGRLLFGIGAGYLEPELQAIGIPMSERGARTDDYLAAMQSIWGERRAAYHGRFVDFAGITARPQPAQQPHLPIVVGGHAPGAIRRAAEIGSGWYGWGRDPDQTAQIVADLQAAAVRYQRPESLGPLEITMTPNGPIDRATAERYAAAGVHRLVLHRWELNADQVHSLIEEIGSTLIDQIALPD